MDGGDVDGLPCASLVFLTFFQQQGCQNVELQKELDSLGRDLKLHRDINGNGDGFSGYGILADFDSQDDGELQTDGHLPQGGFTSLLRDLQDHVQPTLPVSQADAAALREVAAVLIEIADQLEHSVVSQAAENLARKLQASSPLHWKTYLSQEVQGLLRRGPWLEQLDQERVLMALMLTLVKGVCERVPCLLRNLFSTALQYIAPAQNRRGPGVEKPDQERVVMALTLMLVKWVCERAPRLLCNLFSTALQYIAPAQNSG